MIQAESSRDNWVIYAAGSGWGHLTRAVSLARVAAEKRSIQIISSSPAADSIVHSKAWEEFKQNKAISIHAEHRNNDSFASMVQEILGAHSYSCLIVDTFPRGILGEMEQFFGSKEINFKRVFVHRDISPDYVSKYALRDYVLKNYELVINPGEAERPVLNDLAKSTSAWLIRDENEMHYINGIKSGARQNNETPRVVVAMSGKEEQEIFSKIAKSIQREFPEIDLCCLAPAELSDKDLEKTRLDYWPGMDVLSSADLVIGAAGYNTINECAALNVPLIACPLKRKYDRQLERSLASTAITASSLEQVMHHTRAVLEKRTACVRGKDHRFENGAKQAVELIESILR